MILTTLLSQVLLFVFWYCHKRGREVRLEKERLMTESEITALQQEEVPLPSSSPTTTAPEGAPIEEVKAGMHSDDVAEGNAPYAEGGSLGKELAKEKEEREQQAKKKAETETETEKEKEGVKA